MIKIEVKNCKKCPFSTMEIMKNGHEAADCLAPVSKDKFRIDSYYKKGTSPKWCPLNTNQILISKI